MRSSFIRLSSSLGVAMVFAALVAFGGENAEAKLPRQATTVATSSGMAGACPQGLAAQVAQTMATPSAAGSAATMAATSAAGGTAGGAEATTAATSSAGGAATMAASGPVCLVAEMSGSIEVPPGDSKGTGFAAITIDPASNSVTFDVAVSGIALPATAMHIHKAASGQAGDIVVPARQAPDASGMVTTTTSGVDPALIGQIIANPSGYYVNVHNSAFPGGALRGQLEPYNPNEYPASSTSGTGTGAATPMSASATPGM